MFFIHLPYVCMYNHSYISYNIRMSECDDLDLLIQFTIDTVHSMHAFAFNFLIYLLCI